MELYVTTRAEWRDWLEENHSTIKEIWLVYYKKPSGKPRIPYVEAVEEALCFGWIDGKIRKINEDYYVQRFTPRRPGSRWSKYNIERVERLIKSGHMKPEGMKAYENVLIKPELVYDNQADGDPVIPEDLLIPFKENIQAYTNFLKFSLSTRRIYIDWLNSAKREETRIRRIEKLITLCEQNIRPGIL